MAFSFTQCDVFKARPCRGSHQCLIPLHAWLYAIVWKSHIGGFHFWALMYNASRTICVQVFVWTYIFSFHGNMPRSRITESKITMFNILKNGQSVFQGGCCTILQSCQQSMMVLISLYPYQHLLYSVFLIFAIPVGVKWYIFLGLWLISRCVL